MRQADSDSLADGAGSIDQDEQETFREEPSARRQADQTGQAGKPSSGRSAPAAEPPEMIGRYRIIDVLGEGGMGTVYEAEQSGALSRRLAVKVIKLGMDTKRVVARFEAERQALAVMDHPGVARVFDAGVDATGRPYFAMELVRGQRITKYCDHRKLSIRRRLELFIQLCHAMQHAHHKGVIHRDLKPSNVLVTETDGEAALKVIDFGIARSISPEQDEERLTRLGIVVGTLAYMSPEQAGLALSQDVDTRTDIYALGVILYELLVGVLPVNPHELTGDTSAMLRQIHDTSPLRLSDRLSRSGEDQTAIARGRDTDVATLQMHLRGDLEWITFKAMAGNRSRRYATANGLAMDLRRHLDGEPVLARPPTAGYRLGKFVRRHRVAVGAGAVTILALMVGTTLATLGVVQAKRAEQRAATAAATAVQVSDFLAALLAAPDPRESHGEEITVRQLLDDGADRIAAELTGQPEVQIRLMETMGAAYYGLGAYEKSIAMLREALAKAEEVYGENQQELMTIHRDLGLAYDRQGRFEDAERHLRWAIEIAVETFGSDHLEVADIQRALALTLNNELEFAEAEIVLQQAEAIVSAAAGQRPLLLVSIVHMRAIGFAEQGKFDEAERLHRRALSLAEPLLDDHSDRLALLQQSLGLLLSEQQRYREAEPYLRRALVIQERIYQEDHPNLASTLVALAEVLGATGKPEAAESHFQRALEIRRAFLGSDHYLVAYDLSRMALFYSQQGRSGEAESLFRQSLPTVEEVFGADHPVVLVAYLSLADLLFQRQAYAEAETLYHRVLDARERVFGAESDPVAETLLSYAELLRATGRSEEAGRSEQRAEVIRSGAGGD